METTCFLHDDVLEEILVRLPVKQLLQMKCVCKHWYTLIRDTDFNMKHYQFQYALHLADHNVPLLLESYVRDDNTLQFRLLSNHQGGDILLNITPDFNRDVVFAFANDPEIPELTPRCTGAVNGIVCLQWGCTRLALWNPATREFKDVPRGPSLPLGKVADDMRANILGLGFDIQSKDFKILEQIYNKWYDLIKNEFTGVITDEYYLYSLKANSWKRIKDYPGFFISLTEIDTYYNGNYYWFGDRQSCLTKEVIVTFNFSTEDFKEFEVPKEFNCEGGCINGRQMRHDDGRLWCECENMIKLGNYKESLALFVGRFPDKTECSVEVWVVNKFRDDDYRVPLAWQHAFTIEELPIQSFYTFDLRNVRVSGDLLLTVVHATSEDDDDDFDDPPWARDKEGCLYYPSTRSFNYFGFKFRFNFTYVETLFSLS